MLPTMRGPKQNFVNRRIASTVPPPFEQSPICGASWADFRVLLAWHFAFER